MIAQKYRDRYYFNGHNMFDRWGIIIESGGIDELTKMPTRKEQYNYDWLDENGTERYVDKPVFNSKSVTLNITFLCGSLEEYYTKSDEFMQELMMNGYFLLYNSTLKKEYKLLYNGVNSVVEKCGFDGVGEVVVTYSISLVDDFLFYDRGDIDYKSVPLLWSDSGVEYLWTDENNFYKGILN